MNLRRARRSIGLVSNLAAKPQEELISGHPSTSGHELIPAREVPLGRWATMVRRTLPGRARPMVGAWCFVDHYGPDDISGKPGMQVPPHPHTQLQTVSWLVEGEILHRDSLGNLQRIRPGQLNLMTAGHGIAHSEESPADHGDTLHGVQLWVALREADRDISPAFENIASLPRLVDGAATTTLIIGELHGEVSPARVYTPLLGAEVSFDRAGSISLPLDGEFEHAAITLEGEPDVDDVRLAVGPMLYLGLGRRFVQLAADGPARLLLLGGVPFEEPIVMWWNFVGPSHEAIVETREAWQAGRRFGEVHGFAGDRLPAPPLPMARLKPRGRSS